MNYNFALSKEKQSSITKFQKIISELAPKNQIEFIKTLKEFAKNYKNSQNAIQKFLLRKKRKEFINKQLKDRSLIEWVGRINKLQTTENGDAFFEIELFGEYDSSTAKKISNPEFNIKVGTLENINKDIEYKTIINPDNPLYNILATFKEGEWIYFSANMLPGDKDFLKVHDLNEYVAMIRPKFIGKFEFFEKIIPVESSLNFEKENPISKSKKIKKIPRKNNLITSKKIILRYYKNFRLSNYNWNYKKYLNRWYRLIRYHWNNHPPSEYLKGANPKGGEVFVLAKVKKDGRVSNYQVNSFGEVSENMKNSALEAVRVVSLPPIPDDFPDEELKVEFRFEHSRISHFLNEKKDQEIKIKLKDKNFDNNQHVREKIDKNIKLKQILSSAKINFNEKIKQELSSHFKPTQRFNPNIELEIEITLDKNGELIEKEIKTQIESEKFLLAIMNSLSKSSFDPPPKSLILESPYTVLLKITP